jgi:hypothetical protein
MLNTGKSVYFAASTNGGDTWGVGSAVLTGGGITSISALSVSATPAVFVANSTGDGSCAESAVYYASTPNGGNSWNFAALF